MSIMGSLCTYEHQMHGKISSVLSKTRYLGVPVQKKISMLFCTVSYIFQGSIGYNYQCSSILNLMKPLDCR